MSRVGKKPIPIPKGVEVKHEGESITVKGPKGKLVRSILPMIQLEIGSDNIVVSVPNTSRETMALHGLSRALISNMVTGVTRGFEKGLEIVGVGYRAELKGKTAVFHLGYSHPINFPLPDGVNAKIDKTKVTLESIDKELLGETAAKIRNLRPPEPYKGKGIKYVGEKIRRKAGKAGAVK